MSSYKKIVKFPPGASLKTLDVSFMDELIIESQYIDLETLELLNNKHLSTCLKLESVQLTTAEVS